MWNFLFSVVTGVSFSLYTGAKIETSSAPVKPQNLSVLYEMENTKHALRCAHPITETGGCEEARLRAKKSGCITEEDYKRMKAKGAYPVCNFLNDKEVIDGWCACGCFHPDTLITVIEEGENLNIIPAGDLISLEKKPFVSHLGKESHLSGFFYDYSPVLMTTSGKELKKVYEITTEGQRKIVLTSRHPVLTKEGIVKQARHLTTKESVVLLDGSFDPIEKIKKIKTKEDVVNFSLETKDPKEHLIFANDIVVGDLYFQSSLEDLLNSILIRE